MLSVLCMISFSFRSDADFSYYAHVIDEEVNTERLNTLSKVSQITGEVRSVKFLASYSQQQSVNLPCCVFLIWSPVHVACMLGAFFTCDDSHIKTNVY